MSSIIKGMRILVPSGLQRKTVRSIRSFQTYQGLTGIDERRKQRQLEIQKELMARGLPKKRPLKGVKQILIVASGKGGVGKSTTAVNLSVALKSISPEKSVGLLDADVFGPSLPLMMNIRGSPLVNKEHLMEPLINYGIKCMSMGFLIDENSPVVWRGLMVMSALDKLMYQVAWGPLDYLIVDTPPGTGDTHLTIMQNVPVAGALLVTTPQKAALDVTRRGAGIFDRMHVPIAGIVENMSSISCPKCTTQIALFGDGTKTVAKELGVEILEKIPLSESIMEGTDAGKPIVLSAPKSVQAEAYRDLAKRVITFLKDRPVNED